MVKVTFATRTTSVVDAPIRVITTVMSIRIVWVVMSVVVVVSVASIPFSFSFFAITVPVPVPVRISSPITDPWRAKADVTRDRAVCWQPVFFSVARRGCRM